jgi:uncharacterized glyoxalase superfamily protein PhnB
MSDNPPTTVWPALIYKDAPAALDFLTGVFGFEEALVVRDDDNPDVIHHAELRWPHGGGVMFGTADRDESVFSDRHLGAASIYVVTDEPDRLYEKAVEAGAEVVRGLRDEDYGSRGFTVHDPEGNLWSFGTYQGA